MAKKVNINNIVYRFISTHIGKLLKQSQNANADFRKQYNILS